MTYYKKNAEIDIFYTDMEKAFDSVSYQLLIQKLEMHDELRSNQEVFSEKTEHVATLR